MALPDTGGVWAEVVEPELQPLAVRYWQITDAFIMDYRDVNGVPINWADPSKGLGADGLFTPIAKDGNIREDLLLGSGNIGLYHCGELKEDIVEIDSEMSVQQTPTAQSVRTVRNVITKLSDKLSFTMIESGPLQDYLRYEKPLVNGIPDIGTAGYQVSRDPMDQLIERSVLLFGVDTDGFLRGEFFPRVITDKKGKTELQRKNPEGLSYAGEALPDPYSRKVMWVCRDGKQWRALGGKPTGSTVVATPQVGLKVQLVFTISGDDVQNPTFAATKTTGGTTTALALQGSPVIVSNGDGTYGVTLIGTSLTATTVYTGQITITGDNGAITTIAIPSFTSTSS